MNFEEKYISWLENNLSDQIPDKVKAFSFNLYEPALEPGFKFGVELIGAERFDENDPDWACDEVWVPKIRGTSIPVDYSGDTWEECLEKMKSLVTKHLDADTLAVRKLKKSSGIGLGFVDGDLEIIWKP